MPSGSRYRVHGLGRWQIGAFRPPVEGGPGTPEGPHHQRHPYPFPPAPGGAAGGTAETRPAARASAPRQATTRARTPKVRPCEPEGEHPRSLPQGAGAPSGEAAPPIRRNTERRTPGEGVAGTGGQTARRAHGVAPSCRWPEHRGGHRLRAPPRRWECPRATRGTKRGRAGPPWHTRAPGAIPCRVRWASGHG